MYACMYVAIYVCVYVCWYACMYQMGTYIQITMSRASVSHAGRSGNLNITDSSPDPAGSRQTLWVQVRTSWFESGPCGFECWLSKTNDFKL